MGEREKEDYKFWISQGLCPHCHKHKMAPGKRSCPECLEKSRKRMAESRKKKIEADPGYLERARQENRESVRAYRERHKAMGLCVHCSRKALPGIQLCEKHRQLAIRNNNQYRRHRRKREHLDAPMPGKRTKTDLGKLFALYNAGWTIADIAVELKVVESTVYKWISIARKEKEEKK